MGCFRFSRNHAAAAVFLLIGFAAPLLLQADVVLPASNFACGGTSVTSCGGSGSQLPDLNGIQGVEITGHGGAQATSSAQFVFDVTGALVGDISAGTTIPFTFSFGASSADQFGTEIVSSDPSVEVTVGGQFFGGVIDQLVTNDVCGPGFPLQSTCTNWMREGYGNGTLTLTSGISSGSSMEIAFAILLDTTNNGGTPTLSLGNATFDLNANPVPEPRHATLALIGMGLLCVVGRTVRARLRSHAD